MKRLIALLIVCSLVGLTACSEDSSSVDFNRDEYGNNVILTDSRRTVMLSSLPYTLDYNDSGITLEDVSAYEVYLDSSYSYMLYIIVTLDFSDLDEAQQYWLFESDLNVHAYITSEDNDYDFDSAFHLGSLKYSDEGKITYVFTASFYKDNRHSFGESKITVAIDVEQEDDEVETNGLQYSVVLPETVTSAEEIDETLISYMAKWLEEYTDTISSWVEG